MRYAGKFIHRREQGITLLVALILLVVMTLLAISAFHLGTTQTVVVGNAQRKMQAEAAAQLAIDTVVNSSNFTKNPAQAILNSGCDGGGVNKLCVSSNGDGVNDITVTLTPKPYCVTAASIPANQLDLSNGSSSPDLGCLSSPQQNQFAVEGATSGNTICANSTWEVNAVAADSTTGTSVTVTQGVAQRILTAQMSSYCP